MPYTFSSSRGRITGLTRAGSAFLLGGFLAFGGSALAQTVPSPLAGANAPGMHLPTASAQYNLDQAMEQAKPASVAVRALIDATSKGVVSAQQVFPGPNGLTGVVVNGPHGGTVVWLSPSKHYVLVGYLYTSSGENLTKAAIRVAGIHPHNGGQPRAGNRHNIVGALMQAGENPNAKLPAGIKGLPADLAKTNFNSFTTGHGPVQLTAVIDPNCIFCHKFWQTLTSMPNWRQTFTVKWVPVGFLKQSSAGKAAAVIDGGWKALVTDETGFNDQAEEGAISPISNPDALAKVKSNNRAWGGLMSKIGVQAGTPTLIFGDRYVIPGALNQNQLSLVAKAMARVAPAPKPAPAAETQSQPSKTSAEPSSPPAKAAPVKTPTSVTPPQKQPITTQSGGAPSTPAKTSPTSSAASKTAD